MKITHLTTLKHKLQWLVLLAALLGVNQGVWAGTIYFDTSETGWTTVNLGQGHSSYSCFNTGMTLVTGTKLYKKDNPSWWSDETQFCFTTQTWGCEGNSISHRMGWIGDNNCTYPYENSWTAGKIYTTNGTSTCTSCGNGGKVKAYAFGSTKDYSTTYTVTITAPTGGTITVAYTNTSGTAQSKTSTVSGLIYTTVLTITATPSSGYTLGTLTVDGSSFTSGNTYILKKNITISATFNASCTAPTVQTVSGTATICSGSSTNVRVASSQTGYTYKLYKNGSATATTKAGTGSALNFPVSAAGTYTVYAYDTSTSGCNTSMSGSAVITVNSTSVGGTATATASTVCSGTGTTISLTGNTGSIQWQKSTTSSSSGFSNISGATTSSLSTGNLTQNTWYRAVVTSGVCSSVNSSVASVSVDPYPAITAQPTASQTVCSGSTPTSISVTATGTGLSYQWQMKTTGDWSDVANKTASTFAWGSVVTGAGTWYYRCKITASCGATIYSNTHTLTGVANASIASVTLTSSSVCKGQGLSATANGVVLGGGTGAWSSSNTSVATVNSGGTIATPGAGTANIIYTITGGCGGTKSAQASLKVKATATASQYTLTNNAQTYNGSARVVTVTPASGAGAATVYYTGTGSTTYAKSTTAPTNAGSYSITIDAAAGDDYCAATNLSLGTDSIKKATQSTLTISNTITSLVYCDDASVTLTTSGGSGGGAVTYAVTSGSGSVDGDVLSPSAKGSVSVVADKAASTNYRGIKSVAKTFNFNIDAPEVFELSNVGGATTICGDPSSGAGSGTLRLADSQTDYKYQLYSNGAPIEGYAAKAGTTGSSIDFPVTSSGTYTVYAYYGDNSTNCPTRMDGEITLTISTQPRLVRSAASVTEYMPVTITSVSTDIAEWKIVDGSGNDVSSSTAYLFDQTYDAISFKGASTNGSTAKTYTIQATTAGGCSETTTVTVNPDTEACN